MPMQPENYPIDNLGPYCLLDNLSDTENNSRAEWIADKAVFSDGIYLNTDQIFTLSSEDTKWFFKGLEMRLDEMNKKILMFYYDPKELHSIEKMHRNLSLSKIDLMKIDVSITRDTTDQEILEAFGYAELISKARGLSVIVCDSKLYFLEKLKKWIDELDDKGIEIAFLSN